MSRIRVDPKVILKAREGDTSAFQRIVEAYKDVSLSLACSILKDETDAEDVLQEVFIKVYEKISSFREEADFSTWLYRIVVNSCHTALRKRRWIPGFKKAESYQTNKLQRIDQRFYINQALELLRSDEALVLRLHYLGELEIREIQEATGFGQSKIKMNLVRGRKNFQKALKKLLGEESHDLL